MSLETSAEDRLSCRAWVLTRHLASNPPSSENSNPLKPVVCSSYIPPELEAEYAFDTQEMRKLLDGHNVDDRDWLFGLMKQAQVFNPRDRGGRVYAMPDYNQTTKQQREMTMRRIGYLLERGVFDGWLTDSREAAEWRKLALHEVIGIYDHSLGIKLGVHFFLWGGAIQFFGTKSHHDKWLRDTETYAIKGCFAMTELGHGSNVCKGIETVTTYDPNTKEFVINTPCESVQKYWIGGAANLNMNGKNEGVHAFIAQIRDADGNTCPNIRIADCGHKIGLNGVDNGRIWFDNVQIPRENLLNSVADVSPDGQYLSSISDQDQRFAAFLAPLTSGRVTIAASAVYEAKTSLVIAIRYALSRRAFSLTPNGPEVLLLDYPSHQRRLLPLLAKTKALFSEYVAFQKRQKPFNGLGLEHMNGPGPVIPSQLTSIILRSCEFQINAMRLREQDLLNHFALEVSHHQAKGESKESSFVLSYQLAEDLARAFSDRSILQIFIEAEAKVPEGSLKNILGMLRSMYALICLEEDAVFLRYGYLSTDKAADVRKEVAKLCTEIRPHALALVSSFGIPDAFLSPIAYDWIQANSWSSVKQ